VSHPHYRTGTLAAVPHFMVYWECRGCGGCAQQMVPCEYDLYEFEHAVCMKCHTNHRFVHESQPNESPDAEGRG
jgi:hypothetical protein